MSHALASVPLSGMSGVRCDHSPALGTAIPLQPPAGAALYGRGHPGRDPVETRIAQQFAGVYGARVSRFMPWLLALERDDTVVAAMGLRPAGLEPLFIEQYLDEPIEQALDGRPALPRGQIVEIGNLAAMERGASALLFMVAAELLFALGYERAVFNATLTVQNSLAKLGLDCRALGQADPSRLGEAAADWGSYYATPSTLIAVSLVAAHHTLAAAGGEAMHLAARLAGSIARDHGLPRAIV